MHTTNYYDTFILVAEDCPVTSGEIPPLKGNDKTIANLHFEMVVDNPYKYTSDDIIFHAYAIKNCISGKAALAAARETFFSKGQACLRASPLTKRYGWGVHSNAEGKVAIYDTGSKEYKQFSKDKTIKQLKAMRSKKAP
jgi:Family of unknown function (DUF6157)